MRQSIRPLLALLGALLSWEGFAEPPPPGEYDVKAAYIHHFARLVQWPATADPAALRLCLVGGDPFGHALDPIRAETVEGRRWEIVPPDRNIAWDRCDIAFIERSAAPELTRILADIGQRPVLTIGDTEGYGEHGVIINFYPEDRKIHFEINLAASRRAGFSISSQLLKLARRLPGEGQGHD